MCGQRQINYKYCHTLQFLIRNKVKAFPETEGLKIIVLRESVLVIGLLKANNKCTIKLHQSPKLRHVDICC